MHFFRKYVLTQRLAHLLNHRNICISSYTFQNKIIPYIAQVSDPLAYLFTSTISGRYISFYYIIYLFIIFIFLLYYIYIFILYFKLCKCNIIRYHDCCLNFNFYFVTRQCMKPEKTSFTN